MVSLHALYLAAALTGSGETVLLDFTASWCGHCQTMRPTVQRLRDAGYPVREVDVDREPDLARRFSVQPVPCFVLVVNGQEVDRVVGAASFDRLVRMFQNARWQPSRDDPAYRGQSPDSDFGSPIEVRPIERPQFPTNPASLSHTGASADATQSVQSGTVTPQQLALQATVHLTVVDATGQSHGTGTIVDAHGDEALIVTCGHLFRESNGNCEIFVELFLPGARDPVKGYLLSYEAEKRDIGLVSIRPGRSITPIQVAAPEGLPRQGERVFSIGCNHGSAPTVQDTSIASINRYLGPPNLETFGHPVIGRSGGGLFNSDGCLVGICNAADLEEDRGIYASLPIIHDALAQIGQEQIIGGGTSASNSVMDRQRPSTTGQASPPAATATTAPRAGDLADDQEIICFVRSRSGRQEDQMFLLERPSADLLQWLAQESQQPPKSSRLVSLPSRQGNPPPGALPRSQGTVVRAQNR